MGRTGYHLLDISPWPFGTSLGCLGVACGFIGFFYEGFSPFVVKGSVGSLICLGLSLTMWWWDIIVESTWCGGFTTLVIRSLRVGFVLFMISEASFFAGFFWAYLYAAIGELSMKGVGQWPPLGIKPIDAWKIPLLNTAILLTSGAIVNVGYKSAKVYSIIPLPFTPKAVRYYYIMKKWHRRSMIWFAIGICLGIAFLYYQYQEFYMASYTIADSVYGSAFYMLVGLHGLHVLFGVVFLMVTLGRLRLHHFSYNNFHFGMTASVWYWHFVDVIWILVFFVVYVWGGS